MTKKTLGVSKSDNTHWPSLRRLTTVKPPLSGVRYDFTRQFKKIIAKAKIEHCEFHDLRRACLTRWFAKRLREYDVMNLAGHADFETTRRFYLAVREDLLQRARKASAEALGGNFVAHLLRTPPESQKQKRLPSISA